MVTVRKCVLLCLEVASKRLRPAVEKGTGTHYIPVTTDSIFLFNPARRGLILRIIPGFELLGIGLSRVVGIGRTDQINADGLQTTHGLENWG